MKYSSPVPVLAVVLLVAAGFILLSGQSLPPVVASHFGAGGSANGYMSRGAYLGLMLVMTLVVPGVLAVGHRLVGRVPRRRVSLPERDYWLAPERSAETFSFLRRHLSYLSALSAVFFCFVHWLVVRANALQPPQLSVSLFFGGLVAFLVAVAVWVAALLVRFRRRA